MPTPKQLSLAKQQGQKAGREIWFDSLLVFNPYDCDTEAELYEAWQDAFDNEDDIRSEMIHFGI